MTTADEILADLLSVELAEHGSVRPPWIRLPDTHPFDIGWRMGAGETHLMLWSAWAREHDAGERIAAIRGHGAVPTDWAWWAAEAVDVAAEDDPYDVPEDEIRRRLEAVGIAVAGPPEEE